MDGDGNKLKTDKLTEGVMPVYNGEVPTKTATAQYLYTFNNTWAPEISIVNGNAVYTAQFNQTLQKYTVTWENDDHTILETDEYVPYGETPRYDGKTPEKVPTKEYTYTFDGWNREIAAVTGKVTYTAVYKATAIATETPSATQTPTPEDVPSPTPKPIPKTGEPADPMLYLILVLLGTAGIGGTAFIRQRRK